jgi:uncharacterized protein YkuJ
MNADIESFNDKAKNISQIVDEHMAWLHDITTGNTDAPSPEGVVAWIDGAHERDDIDAEDHRELKALYHNLASASPSHSLKDFADAHRDFMKALRASEKSILSGGEGLRDAETGLATMERLEKDYETEMERFSRNGIAFCTALLIPDNQNMDLATLTAVALKSKRHFDDVYRVSDNEFFIMLRQTDMAGAMAAITRLKSMLAEQKDETVSVCLAEPVEEEGLKEVLEKLRFDLEKVEDRENLLIEHQDISPLQRYLSEGSAD